MQQLHRTGIEGLGLGSDNNSVCVGGQLWKLESVYASWVQTEARSVTTDPSHPKQTLLRGTDGTGKATTIILKNLFFPELSKSSDYKTPHAHNHTYSPILWDSPPLGLCFMCTLVVAHFPECSFSLLWVFSTLNVLFQAFLIIIVFILCDFTEE